MDASPSAATAEPELIGVCWWWGWVVTGEAGVTEAVRAVRNRSEHPFERQIPERIDADVRGDLLGGHVGRNELLAVRRVNAVVAWPRNRRRGHAHMHFPRPCCPDHCD